MRKNCYNLFKKYFLIVSLYYIVISASIFLVDIRSQVASAHWYFLERFLELSELSFFLKVQG